MSKEKKIDANEVATLSKVCGRRFDRQEHSDHRNKIERKIIWIHVGLYNTAKARHQTGFSPSGEQPPSARINCGYWVLYDERL